MSDYPELRNTLNQLAILSEAEWKDFVTALSVRKFNKGDYLIHAGEVEHFIYFLARGATRNYFTKDGKDFTVDFQFAGSLVTAYYSFITREPSEISIELLEDSEAVVIPHSGLQRFYAAHPRGERIGRLMAEMQYTRRLRKEMDLLSLTAEERYSALMEKHPALVNAISIKHLSSYLGIEPESLSRIRKRYRGN